MIKPVTFQGVFNFNANLYALEVKSRFIDQAHADGFYKGYGEELKASIVGTSIHIGTGAFCVQGRMCEVVSTEVVTPGQLINGYKGYVVARVETYHPADENNVTFIAKLGTSLDAIPLVKEDIYATVADKTNKVYEYPIYSFAINDTTITALQKIIQPVADYATLKKAVDDVVDKATSALSKATTAESNSTSAVTKAGTAEKNSAVALSKATTAESNASDAKQIAGNLDSKITQAVATAGQAETHSKNAVNTANDTASLVTKEHEAMSKEIEGLRKQIVEGQGTTVTKDGVQLSVYNADDNITIVDTIELFGGKA